MPAPIVVNDYLTIAADELEVSFARSSGPGGQNVNKVNTKAVLRWRLASGQSLPAAVRERFKQRFPSRITTDGDVVISGQTHREQARNLAECYEKLRAMVLSVANPPRVRRKTKPSRSAVERRLQSKQRRSQTKRNRRPPRLDE